MRILAPALVLLASAFGLSSNGQVSDKDKKDPPVPGNAKKHYVRNPGLIKLGVQDPNSNLCREMLFHPATMYNKAEAKELHELAKWLKNKQRKPEFQRDITSRLPAHLILPIYLKDMQDKRIAGLPFYQGLANNPNLPKMPADKRKTIEAERQAQANICTKKFRPITPTDVIAAEQLKNTVFGYRVGSHPTNKKDGDWPNYQYRNIDPNCAYVKGIHQMKEITDKDIEWSMKKENINTIAAYEIGKRITEEQLTHEIRKSVSGPLSNTRFAKGVATSKFLGYVYILRNQGPPIAHRAISEKDTRSKRWLHYALDYPSGNEFGRGLYRNETVVASEILRAKAQRKYVNDTEVAYNFGRYTWGEITKDTEKWMMENHKTRLASALAGNDDYTPSGNMRGFAKQLAKTNPQADILFHLTNNKNFVKGLTQKQLQEEVQYALDNPNSEHTGIFENEAVPFSPILVQCALDNPNTLAAVRIARHKDFMVTNQIRSFVRGENNKKNQKTLFASEVVAGSKSKYYPSHIDLGLYAKRAPEDFTFNLNLSLNPYMQGVELHYPRRELLLGY